ncbi:MAG: folate-binding protein YgfZ [Gammaproteobacteria bacterium]|nr:folate-binding protein YgfZ [Gammaproteobacteria bacterium]
MHKQWQDFLIENGAVIEGGRLQHFGNPQAERQLAGSADVLTDLSHLADLLVSGDDAATFLQGQLTNDIHAVSATHSQLSGFCNPQGRLLALFRILADADGYHLLLPADLLLPMLGRLRMFVLRSKVTLSDRSDDTVHIGVSGPQLARVLAGQLPSLPATAGEVCRHASLTVLRLAGDPPRFLISGPFDAVHPLWDRLAAHGAPVGAEAWRLLDIRAGQPEVVLATSNQFIPQMLNLRELDAINFRKGCYTGQEIVARLQYRGTLKRRMYHARINATTPPDAGDPVHVCGEAQASGHLVSVAAAPDGGFEALAVVTVEHSDQPLCHGGPDGNALQLMPPPYAFAPLAKD